MTHAPVLKVENLQTRFKSVQRGKYVHAVDDVSIELYPGEIVGLVGESGCGKSTLGRTIVGLEKASAGRVLLDGVDLSTLSGAALRNSRRALQYVFQDPYSSLNDRQTVGEAIDEALLIDGLRSADERTRRAKELLEQVGLPHTARDRHTRELSGGQRQRVAIARSLAVNPRVLICDEPVSSLDLSIRAQVMNLFLRLQKDLGVACLFIAHDLALVRQAASRVYVMYLGKIVEHGPSQELYDHPGHPYSQMLLASVPEVDPRVEKLRSAPLLKGEVPSPTNPPSGCRFRTRCPLAVEDCALRAPASHVLSPDHNAACIFAPDLHGGKRSALIHQAA
ncbi:ATP-binding cassette domain-containing protein [Sinorhizobium medicae]|nr:ATP-binding cassette domain-containing protein [Sinorhizobium medicae]MDX0900219.1 ATP-binding cassette domain-containing protein [Sinorhizobium medicae]MDX1121377.1 ATP-binding cassette domain-containing protein [Sinorhizobium medicae]MDX1243725.1 ATP-binding cassette domain-containing protein [Sinorhizobium medicae]